MNQNRKLDIDKLFFLLESLEEYIRHANYSDLTIKEQFFRRTLPNSNKWDLDNDKDNFYFVLSVCQPWIKEQSEDNKKEVQKEFYKWIDYSGITAENCSEELKNCLNLVNEVLAGRGDEFKQVYDAGSKEEWKEIVRVEKSPVWVQASQEVNRFFFGEPIPTKPREIYDVEIKGDAEQGQKIFQQIKNSITSQPDWTFPWKEKYYKKLREKIKELEGKRGQEQPIQPKENWKPGYIIDTFVDILEEDLELYIQKLDYYPNFKAHEWEKKEDQEHWEKKSVSEVESLPRVGLKTMAGILGLLKRDDPDYYPILINQLKSKFYLWQKEHKIEISNSPHQLREILLKFNEVLDSKKPWKKMKDERSNENENKEEELAKIIVEIKFELAGLKKNANLDSELNDLENKLKHSKTVSEARGYQQQIRQKINQKKKKQQELDATNENKLSLPVKLAIGAGVGLLVMVIVYWVIKNRKIKK